MAAGLAAREVRAVALTWVDNAGITRVKAVPVARLPEAAAWGVGMSPVFDVFCVDDSITTSAYVGGPVGDLRLHPDLDRLTVLAAQRGWAWAPVDRWTQDGEPYPGCQRMFARRMVERAAAAGLTLRMAVEVEWYVGVAGGSDGDLPRPACEGPAYGMTRMVELSDYADDALTALAAEGVAVEQFHPEYAAGQFEVSVAATDPVGAADLTVLVRQTVRAVTARHGLRVSFAPVVVAGQVGNGAHLHFSVTTGGQSVRRRRRSVRHHHAWRVRPRRSAGSAARAGGRRRAECGQLPAAGAAAVGRGVPLLGSGESGGRAEVGHRSGGNR